MSEQDKLPPPPEDGEDKEKFFDPVTGEQISKSAHKKLMKNAGAPKKEKKEKPVFGVPSSKEKKVKVEKEPEQIFLDTTPVGEKKQIADVFPLLINQTTSSLHGKHGGRSVDIINLM